jgi:hypothetical protein
MAACPECGAKDLRLTAAGMLYKHDGADGETCPGGGEPPAMDDGADTADLETSPDPPADDSSDEARNFGYGQAAYEWQLTICQPALYLNDGEWHAANALGAADAARQAGRTPTGEAQCTNVAATEDGAGLVLTYTVPVETGGQA